MGFGTLFFWVWAAAFLRQSLLMTWMIARTRGSILSAVLFHAFVDISGEIVDVSLAGRAIGVGLGSSAAAVVALRWWPRRSGAPDRSRGR